MKNIRYPLFSLLSIIAMFIISSCSTSSSLPYDDVYYSSKDNKKVVNEDLSSQVYSAPASAGDYQSYKKETTSGSESQVPVGAGSSGTTTYSDNGDDSDIYYDSDYESRIKRFNNEGSSLGYYDDYYTNDCGCSSGSNWSVSVGVGAGYGWGWSVGYGYGWPYYGWGWPYYGYYRPYWGYYPPYYGWGGSYWAGYNNGYWNGYWDGYYGYGPGYGGGYYPDYGYGRGYSYRPRNGRGGGTNVPRTGSRGGSGTTNPAYREKTVVAGGSGIGSSRGGNAVVAGGTNSKSTPAGTVNRQVPTAEQRNRANVQAKPELSKPVIKQEYQSKTNADNRYRGGETSKSDVSSKPRYEKPKSYRSLPAQQAKSGNDYVAPRSNTQRKNANTQVNKNVRRPVNTPKLNYRSTGRSSGSSTKSVNRSGNSRNSGSYTPSRSNTSRSKTSRSYTPSRSNSSKSYSSPSRSYSSPSRSSGSLSRSSGSSSRSSGGSRSGGRR